MYLDFCNAKTLEWRLFGEKEDSPGDISWRSDVSQEYGGRMDLSFRNVLRLLRRLLREVVIPIGCDTRQDSVTRSMEAVA